MSFEELTSEELAQLSLIMKLRDQYDRINKHIIDMKAQRSEVFHHLQNKLKNCDSKVRRIYFGRQKPASDEEKPH